MENVVILMLKEKRDEAWEKGKQYLQYFALNQQEQLYDSLNTKGRALPYAECHSKPWKEVIAKQS